MSRATLSGVAQVVSKIVFVDPGNLEARNLEADALEQLGYQAESGPWRNFYLTGAQELRNGVVKGPTPNTASPDTVRAMTPEMFSTILRSISTAKKPEPPKRCSISTLATMAVNIS